MPPAALPRQLDALEALHGPPAPPAPRGVLAWILWENAAYLVKPEQRDACFRGLLRKAGPTAAGIARAPREELLELAQRGGMHPDARVEKWLEIARIVRDELDGDPEGVLALPLAKARSVLRRFPGIGEPGAEKVLLFAGKHPFLAPESNGLRVLVRLGHVREQKSYSATYRALREALAPLARRAPAWHRRAHLLLHGHGQQTCKRTAPSCDECPLSAECPAAV